MGGAINDISVKIVNRAIFLPSRCSAHGGSEHGVLIDFHRKPLGGIRKEWRRF
jgi:hypothetical protein